MECISIYVPVDIFWPQGRPYFGAGRVKVHSVLYRSVQAHGALGCFFDGNVGFSRFVEPLSPAEQKLR